MEKARIVPTKNGPYLVEGPFEVIGATGGILAPKAKKVYLCRCGQSSHKPFCDGTHEKVGFQADGVEDA